MTSRQSESGAKKPEMNPMVRFYKKSTRKGAIHAKCCECMGCSAEAQGSGYKNHLEAGFSVHIRNCSAPTCPLFSFRPFQGKADA